MSHHQHHESHHHPPQNRHWFKRFGWKVLVAVVIVSFMALVYIYQIQY